MNKTLPTPDGPCYKCADREMGCHSKCDKYKRIKELLLQGAKVFGKKRMGRKEMSISKSIIRVVLVGMGVCFLTLLIGALFIDLEDIPAAIIVLSLFGGMIGGVGMELSE